MNRYLAMLGLSTALAISAQAFAHDEDNDHIKFYRVGDLSDVDANQDGKISRDEYLSYDKEGKRYDKQWREQHWDEMIEKFDDNDDNQIEVAEIERFAEERVAEVMEKLDDLHGNWIGEFDFNFDDGHFFDSEEFELRLERRLENAGERMEEAMERLHQSERHMEFVFKGLPELDAYAFAGPKGFIFRDRDDVVLEKMDSDDDGKISKEEFLKSRQEMFERLDENNDGVLDEDEMKDFSWMGNYAFTWDDGEDEDDDE